MTENGHDKKFKSALHMGRCSPSGHKWNRYDVTIPAETNPEDLLDPHYWRHYGALLKPSDILECFCDDGSWEASYRVMFVSRAEVKLSLRGEVVRHDKTPDEESDTHEIKWGGPAVKFRIQRKDTGEVIRDGLYPKSEAYNFMRQHLQSIQG